MEPADHLLALEQSLRRYLDTAGRVLDQPVPACPGWDGAALTSHVGKTWGWAATTVETGVRATPPEPPSDRDALVDWAGGEAARLLDALRAADPDAGCWTFGLPRTTRFWFRRQANETVLHARDVEQAAGVPARIDPDVAADGLDEFATVLLVRWAEREPHEWEGQTVHLHRNDGPGEWLMRMGPGPGVEVTREHGKGDLAVRGSAESLWLWAMNREPLDALGLELFGDRSIAERWRAEVNF